MLTHYERTGCDDMALPQPGNDTRTTLLLVTLDRRGKPFTAPTGNRTLDPFAEWPTFAECFTPKPADAKDSNDEYAYGEGSRCLINRPGAAAFTEQVRAATEIPEPERATLIAVREGLAPNRAAAAPTGGAAIAKALEPVQSPRDKSFATYVRGTQAFHDGDYAVARTPATVPSRCTSASRASGALRSSGFDRYASEPVAASRDMSYLVSKASSSHVTSSS